MRDAADLVLASTDELLTTMVELARTHLRTVMIGRTHGVHAEPTTFGAKVALWALQVDRDLTRLRAARDVGRRVQAVRGRGHLLQRRSRRRGVRR